MNVGSVGRVYFHMCVWVVGEGGGEQLECSFVQSVEMRAVYNHDV